MCENIAMLNESAEQGKNTDGTDRQKRRALRDGFIAKVAAENEAAARERNSRRWKSERDPVEYERQKLNQRLQYAAIKGEEVRSYEAIPGATVDEHRANAKARHAQKEKERYAAMCDAERQLESDIRADRGFKKRQRAKGMSEAEIEAKFAVYLATRAEKRAAELREAEEWVAVQSRPNVNIF